MKKKDASYRNVYFDSDSEAGKFTENVYAYPTTYVVDRSGSIVGEPIVGAVTGKSQMEKLKSLIDQCIAADMKSCIGLWYVIVINKKIKTKPF